MSSDDPTTDVNPFQSPQSADSSKPPVAVAWKELAVRWERLRLAFNLIVGLAGFATIVLLGGTQMHHPLWLLTGAVMWGTAANVCYLLGPVTQMYLCWFAETKDPDRASVAEELAGSQGLTWTMFLLGSGFSVLLTIAMAAHEI